MLLACFRNTGWEDTAIPYTARSYFHSSSSCQLFQMPLGDGRSSLWSDEV